MDGTNEPIFEVNEVAPVNINSNTCISYARFFLHFVRGELGHFIIVENLEEIDWLTNATDMEKDKVNQHLMTVQYNGTGSDNLISLTATVIFKNALFKTEIKIAPFEMDVGS